MDVVDLQIFLDESGQTGGVDKEGSQKTFTITTLSIKSQNDYKKMKNILKRFKGELISNGWPIKIREIKAANIFRIKLDKKIPHAFNQKYSGEKLLKNILEKLSSFPINIDHITVNKENILKRLRNAPYGILYNYYAGKILVPRICNSGLVRLMVDARSKEIPDNNKFDGYIETQAYFNTTEPLKLFISHEDSELNHGIQMVDYFCWAINRKFEFNDSRFIEIIKNKICLHKEWYFDK